MKLIDILVEELPKLGGWPKHANCITQDGDLKVEPAACNPSVAKCDDDGFWFLDSSRTGGFEVDTLASDYTTAIITRDQYEAALAAKNEGWIEWGGGECPVQTCVLVDVRYDDGVDEFALEANMPNKTRFRTAAAAWWRKDGSSGDIIAYRLHQPNEATQVKSDDESNMNECIDHDAAPVWSGEGLPPVGCVCEVLYDEHEVLGNTWLKAKIISHDDGNVVGRWLEGNTENTLFDYAINHRDYRQLRTDAERKRDAAVEQMMKFATIHTTKSLGLDLALRSCYDAIAAGKIPGVKLED